jgi:hypothetical protein
MHEDIQGRLNSLNSWYHSVQDILSFCLPSENMKIKIHRTIILPIALYDCQTLSQLLRENRMLRGIFGIKKVEVTGEWRKHIMRASLFVHLNKY